MIAKKITKKQVPVIMGSFVFRYEGEGCLTAKYLENSQTTPYTECAKIFKPQGKELFEGIYHTTWTDAATIYSDADLLITKHYDIYNLEWVGTSGKFSYTGKGFLFEGKLIGSYWKN